ncbi:glutamate decarboxylase gad1 [Entomophthora muscae]|uniref:Glutamate decarboxylase gad1 n=1 Tax=Entomophthora muscae TaxID=34485 RepID=A0ACC2RTR7_9FUNG|nr:glutamate decarboxylase gad1 [Entomophthora muscae]
MALSVRIDPDLLLQEAKDTPQESSNDPHMHSFAYSSRYQKNEVPKYIIPETGMEAKAAYRLVHDELNLDGRSELNCATFLTLWMEPEAEALVKENMNKNFVDADGFPSSMIIHERCISMMAHLWNVPEGHHAIGTVVSGSSEGVILGGLAMKWLWRDKRKLAGKDFSRPNVVLGSNAHCCVEKFARYFDVETRIVPVRKECNYVMSPEDCVKHCDENTIGVYSILGSTYTGHYEDVEALSKALDKLQKETGLDIPIHVDAASGGFVAPFATPNLKWSFDVPRVVSINTSGHKFGLVYAGLGWVMWKNQDLLHKDLVFEMHYLGVTEYSFSLSFSRPSTHIIAQYYNFLRLGHKGYSYVMDSCLSNARYLSRALEQSGMFDVLSDIHRPKGFYGPGTLVEKDLGLKYVNKGLPLVAFTTSDRFRSLCPGIDVADISGLVRTKGWLIPAYSLPMGCEENRILRIVIKEGISEEMIDRLIRDIITACNAINAKSSMRGGAMAQDITCDRPSKSIFEIMEEDCSENPFISSSDEDPSPATKGNHCTTYHGCC